MKELKVAMIATMVTIMLMVTVFAMAPACAEGELGRFMGAVTGVTWVTEDMDELVVRAGDGELVSFYSDRGDFMRGDVVVLTVYETDTDIQVLDAVKIGHLSAPELQYFLSIE